MDAVVLCQMRLTKIVSKKYPNLGISKHCLSDDHCQMHRFVASIWPFSTYDAQRSQNGRLASDHRR
jgi:hypothetical protein